MRNVGAEDAGRYECQLSTVPKLSRIKELIVVVPKVIELVVVLPKVMELEVVVPKVM